MHANALNEIQGTQWAIEPSALEAMLNAVTGDMGQPMPGAQKAYKRGNVGVVDVSGPVASRNGFLERLFGLNSVEQISADLRRLEADDEVSHVVFLVDSPGGTVTGMSDLSAQVRAYSKPTTVFAAGNLASATYWFGSAADRIVASETARIGSIGVVATATAWATPGEITIVSTQTPKKNQSLESKDGLAAMQKMVDELAAVFISDVAKNRGINNDQVVSQYGEGAVFLAREALERGMIDEIATFQAVLDAVAQTKGLEMDLKTLQSEHAGVFEAAVKIGVDTERRRVEAHLVMGEASGDMSIAVEAIKKGEDIDALLTARYQAAAMKKAQMTARAADNPLGLTGEVPGDGVPVKKPVDEGEAVITAVLEGMSAYLGGELS